jgi:hypothetical protein
MRVWRYRTGEGLSPAIRHGKGFVQARVSDDGKEVLFRLEKLGWFTMPMPVQDAVFAEWFLRYAETLAGNRLTSTGRLEELDLTEYEKALTEGRSSRERPGRRLTPPPLARRRSLQAPAQSASRSALARVPQKLEANPAAAEELKRFQ